MNNKFLIMSVESSIRNRMEVLDDLEKYGVKESSRRELEKNLAFFQDKLIALKKG